MSIITRFARYNISFEIYWNFLIKKYYPENYKEILQLIKKHYHQDIKKHEPEGFSTYLIQGIEENLIFYRNEHTFNSQLIFNLYPFCNNDIYIKEFRLVISSDTEWVKSENFEILCNNIYLYKEVSKKLELIASIPTEIRQNSFNFLSPNKENSSEQEILRALGWRRVNDGYYTNGGQEFVNEENPIYISLSLWD